MRLKIFVLFFLLTLILGVIYLAWNNKKDSSSEPVEGLVVKVVDGDTLKVRVGGGDETVRLLGIDAPESVDPNKPVQCYAKEATRRTNSLLGEKVTLVSDQLQADRDEYGRLLRYVFLVDGTNFNKLMIEEGMAREYYFRGKEYKYRIEFYEAQGVAREQKLGIWGVCGN